MQAKTARHEKTAKPSRKLTRAERKQIEAVVRHMLHIPAAERHLHPNGGVVAIVEIAEVFKNIPLILRRSQTVVDVLKGDGLGESPPI
mgnify:CR=1 FL=1